jgi:hypothetical protein
MILLLVLAVPALAQEEPWERPQEASSDVPEEGLTGDAGLGYHDVKLDGSAVRAAEFAPLDNSVHAFANLAAGLGQNGLISYNGLLWDVDDQAHRFRLEAGRSLRFDLDYDSFFHNLDHDPLTNLQSVNGIKVTQYTDFDPDDIYQIKYHEGRASLSGKIAGAPGLYLGIEARDQGRKGTKQSLTTGHCFSCHTFSKTQEIDETTRDIVAFVGYEKRSWDLQYRFLGREFTNNSEKMTRVYDKAHRPNDPNLLVFEDRVQYDSTNGSLPYGVTPDTKKMQHVLKGHWSAKGTVSGALAFSEIENENTNLKTKYDGGRLRYYLPLATNKVAMTLSYRQYDVRTDSILVKPTMREALAGPGDYVGRTYEEVWGEAGRDRGFVANFERNSALNRATKEGKASFRFRLAKRQSLRVEYSSKKANREYFEVTDEGDTETTWNNFRVLFVGRPGKTWRYRVDYTHSNIVQPFAYVNGSCQTFAEDVYGWPGDMPVPPNKSPLRPDSLQYYELYALRRGDPTNQPTDVDRIKVNVTAKLGPRSALNFIGNVVDERNNTTGTGTDWDHGGSMYGLTYWFAPIKRIYGVASYTTMRDEYTSPVCIPLFDG